MRKKNSIRNIIVALILNTINILIGFVAQKIFINTLGQTYLGINGLFTNIISMLSIADLGIGAAITYNLYKPIAEDNKERISILINFYKKSYRIIALVVLILGCLIMPFLTSIISKNDIQNININIYIVFALFLIDTVASYLLTYKRSILYANQKNYIINLVHIGYILILNIIQVVILLFTHNYYLYLIIKIICRILENVIITIIVNKMYPYLRKRTTSKLDSETKIDINRRLKASIFHNVGGFCVLGTDNIIISKFLGISYVGLYSNYYLIINTVNTLLAQIFSGITASLGNLLVEKNNEKSFDIAKKIMFANFWIYSFATIAIYEMINPFIKIWLGENFLFDDLTVIILSLNFYFQGMRRTMQVFAEAAGICYENRYVPLAEAIVNIIASIILVKIMGLPGVFLGTIISSLVLHCYSFPKYIYKQLFNQKPIKYIIENIKYLIVMLIALILTTVFVNICAIQNIYLQIIINALLCITIPNLIFYLKYKNSEQFKYYKELVKNILKKVLKKGEKNETR